jgi:hypothetical protein
VTTMLLDRVPVSHHVPPPAPPVRDDCSRPLDRYLLVDQGDAAGEAAALWLSRSGLLGSRTEVTLLYVSPWPHWPMPFDDLLVNWEPPEVEARRESRAALARLRPLLWLPSGRIRDAVCAGDVLRAVLDECADRAYRAVIVGDGQGVGRGGWLALFRRDPARILLRRLSHPLIVVPVPPEPCARRGRHADAVRRALPGV